MSNFSGTAMSADSAAKALSSFASYKFKVILVGEQAVGKTAIFSRFVYDSFDEKYEPTIALDMLLKVGDD
jgi:Ras-related protein Rab-6A